MLPWVLDVLNDIWNSFDWAKAANIGAILLGIYTWLKFVKPMLRGLALFLEDWNGESPRPGIVPRPGIMKRVQYLEQQADLFIQSEVRQNQIINDIRAENSELKRVIANIEKMVKNVDLYVKDQTGAIPTVPAARSESK